MKELARDLAAHGAAWERCLDLGVAEHANQALDEVKADEGSIWLLNPAGDRLIPVFNNGPDPSSLVGAFQQAMDRGIVSMVLATESAVIERDVHANPQHDGSADKQLGLVTVHMMASPLYFAGESRGVISAVRLRSLEGDEDPPPFVDGDLNSFRRSARALGSRLDDCLSILFQESPEA